MLRLFWGIALPDDIKKRLLALKKDFPPGLNIKWVEADNLHVTLYFAGLQPEATIQKLRDCTRRVAAQMPPFKLTIKGVGKFPPRSNPRVIWAGITNGCLQLQKIHTLLKSEMEAGAYTDASGNYAPHVTLGRVRSYAAIALDDFLQQKKSMFFGDFSVTAIALYNSVLTPKGPIYTCLQRCTLDSTEN
ncbi:MAG: RNA 2',3'-cyclic phosphodiesterase [bacterium]